ncbi:MAG: HAMP domain-containing sensor histidine kinase [Eubacteriales bacterium]|nr:HAMP domain-containing sensor histidine kinase [Eubacteriales bacterium]
MLPLWLTLAAGLGFIVAWLLVKGEYDAERRSLERRLKRAVAEAKFKDSSAERLLATLELGVLSYHQDGQLISANRAARILMPRPPQTFRDFLEIYGDDPAFRSSIWLNSPLAVSIYRKDNISLRLQVQTPEMAAGHIVIVQDYSGQDKEERMRKDFVANVSHELKTPLTTIKTYSESLLEWGIDEKSKEALKKDMQRIFDDSERMEKLISDLLLLSSLDGRGLHLNIEQGDLSWVIKQTCERLQYQAEERGCKLSCQVMNRIPPIYLDRSSIERIATNLISNALKYSRPGKSVDVFIGAVRDGVYFKVKDEGYGIGLEDQEHLFDRFFRVDQTGSRRHGGTGLGLAIVKELVELHQGRIDVNSVLGKGSEFTVILPSSQKLLCDTLEALLEQKSLDSIGESAAADLSELARKLGIVAKWSSLSPREIRELKDIVSASSVAEFAAKKRQK